MLQDFFGFAECPEKATFELSSSNEHYRGVMMKPLSTKLGLLMMPELKLLLATCLFPIIHHPVGYKVFHLNKL